MFSSSFSFICFFLQLAEVICSYVMNEGQGFFRIVLRSGTRRILGGNWTLGMMLCKERKR